MARIESLETLRVVADSQRHRILCLLIDEPLTPSEIARRLKINRTRVYYHLNLLARCELIRVVSERPVAGVIERTYRAAARLFHVDRAVLAANASEPEIADAQAALLERTADDLRARSSAGEPAPEPHDDDVLVSRGFMQLRLEDARELRAALCDLVERYRERSIDSGESYEMTLALFSTERT